LVALVAGFLCFLAPAGGAYASEAFQPLFTAKIFDLKDRSKHMFNYKSEFRIDGDSKTVVALISDLEGKTLVIETTKLSLASGTETLISFEQDQKQLGTVGRLEIKDGRIHFTFTKSDGSKNESSTKTETEKLSGDFVVTSTLVSYLQKNWRALADGKTLRVRYGVLDRLETIGFQFTKEKEKDLQGEKAFVVKMRPSSMIISALVNPLHFSFKTDGSRLLELEGRTAAKVMIDGRYRDFDGYTVYSYP
jgi:hypothetical protein